MAASGLCAVQTGGIVTSAGNNLISIVNTSQVNTISSSSISGTPVTVTPAGNAKMIRAVQGSSSRSITVTLPTNKSGSIFHTLPQKA